MERLDDKDFIILPSLNIILRLFLSSILVSSAYYLQISGNLFLIILGFILLLFFALLNWVRRVKIEKTFSSNTRDWKNTTIEEFKAAYMKVKKIDSFSGKKGSGFSFFFFATIIVIIFITNNTPSYLSFLLIDFLIIIGVVIASGNRYIWTPKGFKQKLSILLRVYAKIMKEYKDKFEVSPQFFVEGEKDKYVPHDAKLMVFPKKKKEGFLGVQFSVSMNDVQGKLYPYFYGVIITRREFNLKKKFEKIKNYDFIKEAKKILLFRFKEEKDNIGIVVIRQKTSIRKGYFTPKKSQDYILKAALTFATEILKV